MKYVLVSIAIGMASLASLGSKVALAQSQPPCTTDNCTRLRIIAHGTRGGWKIYSSFESGKWTPNLKLDGASVCFYKNDVLEEYVCAMGGGSESAALAIWNEVVRQVHETVRGDIGWSEATTNRDVTEGLVFSMQKKGTALIRVRKFRNQFREEVVFVDVRAY